MNSPDGHNQPHPGHSGVGEDHEEKKSVLRKMKEKAKRFKESLKHSLSHEHELKRDPNIFDQRHGQSEDYPAVESHGHGHGHAMPASRMDIDPSNVQEPQENVGIITPKVINIGAPAGLDVEYPGVSLSNPMAMETQDQEHSAGSLSKPIVMEEPQLSEHGYATPASKTYYSKTCDRDENVGLLGAPPGLEEDRGLFGQCKEYPTHSHMPEHTNVPPASGMGFTKVYDPSEELQGNVDAPSVKIGAPAGLEEDPHAPKDWPNTIPPSNYQTKVTDPTSQRGEEARIDPLVSSFGEMSVEDEKETESRPNVGSEVRSYSGDDDQFAPLTIPHMALEGSKTPQTTPQTTPKHYDLSKPDEIPGALSDGKQSSPEQGTYTEKISSAARAIADKAVSVKDAVASSVKDVVESEWGYGDVTHMREEEEHYAKPLEQSSYTDKKLSSANKAQDIEEKEAIPGSVKSTSTSTSTDNADIAAAAAVTQALNSGVGSSSISEVQVTKMSQEVNEVETKDKGVPVKEYLAEKFIPREEDKALSDPISGDAKLGGTGMGFEENERAGEVEGECVVEKLKGAITSLLGGGESQTSHSDESSGNPLGTGTKESGEKLIRD